MARAGGVTLGYLRYVLGLDTLTFKKGMTEAERDLMVMQKRFEKFGSNMASLGNKLTVGLTAPLAAFAAKGISEARETAAAMAQVNAALSSMGPVAGRTAAQLEKAATSFESRSLFEADQILQKVTANLLTFGNISGQAFDRAQQAAVDLATRMGTDLQSAAILVGKALNDPIKGMAALGRAGIQFTAAQKEQIKALVETGNAAAAQSIILKELERQFGGAAQAAQNADPWNKAKDAFNQMAETVGTALLPLIPPLTEAIVKVANAFTSLSPETQKWILIIGAGVVALGPFLSVLGNVILVISNAGPLVALLAKGWGSLAAIFVKSLPTLTLVARGLLLLFSNPFVLGAALLIGGIYLAWKNWDKIVEVVRRVYNGVKTWIQDKLKVVFEWVKGKLQDVGDWFERLYDRVVGNSYVPDMVDEIGAQMARLDALLVQPVTAATTKAAEAFRALQEQTAGLLDRLFPEAAALNTFKSEIDTLDRAMKAGILTANQYAAALSKLQTEGLTDEPIGVVSQGTLVPSNDNVEQGIERSADNMDKILTTTSAWSEVVTTVATDIARITGDWLSAFIDGSAKLKDLWRVLLGYAINALTSSNGPLQALFGGTRAAGGPVMSGRAYLVGERGPELFMPGASGKILSNDNTRAALGGGATQNFYFPNSDADSFRRSESQVRRSARRALGV
jgi:hypothetical protein